MAYYAYVLQSIKDQKYYIGSTSDPQARLVYHNSGRQRATKHRIPFVLVFSEQFESKTDALKRERYLKALKGGEGFKKILASKK